MSCAYRSPATQRVCGKPADDPIHTPMAIASYYAEFPRHAFVAPESDYTMAVSPEHRDCAFCAARFQEHLDSSAS